MRIISLTIVALALIAPMIAAGVDAAPDWIVPPDGPTPPEPEPPTGGTDSGCVSVETVTPRWYMPFVATPATVDAARCYAGCDGMPVHMLYAPLMVTP